MSVPKAVTFPAMVRFRAEPGLSGAIAQAARLNRTSTGEYLRRAVRERVTADGVRLPPLGPDDGPGAPPAAPAMQSAA